MEQPQPAAFTTEQYLLSALMQYGMEGAQAGGTQTEPFIFNAYSEMPIGLACSEHRPNDGLP